MDLENRDERIAIFACLYCIKRTAVMERERTARYGLGISVVSLNDTAVEDDLPDDLKTPFFPECLGGYRTSKRFYPPPTQKQLEEYVQRTVHWAAMRMTEHSSMKCYFFEDCSDEKNLSTTAAKLRVNGIRIPDLTYVHCLAGMSAYMKDSAFDWEPYHNDGDLDDESCNTAITIDEDDEISEKGSRKDDISDSTMLSFEDEAATGGSFVRDVEVIGGM